PRNASGRRQRPRGAGSVTIEELLTTLDAHDIRVALVDGRLSCDAPRGRLTPALRAALEVHRDGLIARLASRDVIARQPRDGRAFPLSHAQRRLWLLDRLEGGTPRYNIVAATRLTGSIDVDAARRALRAVVERHEVLRTRFVTRDGDVVQVPLAEMSID